MRKMMMATSLFLLGIAANAGYAGADAALKQGTGHASHPHSHRQYSKLKNPVSPTEQSMKQGKAVFEKHCIACHSTDGKGIGPDLTDQLWIHGPSDGEIFHVISDGVAGTTMKGFKDMLPQEMRWDLVNYIRSTGSKRSK